MNQKAPRQQMSTVIDSFSAVLRDIEQLRLLELSQSLQERPVEWSLSMQWPIEDVTLQMEPDGSISLSSTVPPNT